MEMVGQSRDLARLNTDMIDGEGISGMGVDGGRKGGYERDWRREIMEGDEGWEGGGQGRDKYWRYKISKVFVVVICLKYFSLS
jgi:hypothetical protein